MIVVIGSVGDLRVDAVLHYMDTHTVPYLLWDTVAYPYNVQLTQTVNGTAKSGIYQQLTELPVADITAVYYCTQSGFRVLESDPPEIQNIVYSNIESAAWSFFHALDCPFVNPIAAADRHNYKTYVLKTLHNAGIPVPETVVTNRPEAVLDFYRQKSGNVIYKPAWGQAFTRLLTEADLTPDTLSKLENSPIMLQEYIAGSEVRAYVIGDKVFGVRVESTEIDINEDNDAQRRPFELPADVIRMCKQVAEVAGLLFTAIDMRVTPEGKYIVLEANSSPDFTADEYQTGYPLCETLVALLQG